MARYVYTGKKKNFKLGESYSHQTAINPGVPFELTGKDLILLKRCLDNAKEQGEKNPIFVLAEEHALKEEIKKEEAKVAEEEPTKRGRKPNKVTEGV